MITFASALAAAGWLGILTSISPCPLATNIAAVSFLSRRMHSRSLAVAGAFAYALGRATLYTVIGFAIACGMAATPHVSSFLQSNIVPFIGPLLILSALVLLGWIKLPIGFGVGSQRFAERLATFGLLGEFALGMLFALTFCPVSAALFFGALLPLALSSGFAFPVFVVYGVGTALPVGAISILAALGVAASARLLSVIQRSQNTIQNATAVVILLAGIWLTLSSSLNLF